ncbi:vacuolar transporter chaperone [Nowakowskiella sp. JEL0078]|nr:vacuolar transporter chaperone [Nowakowskiella sp. JEL0078]
MWAFNVQSGFEKQKNAQVAKVRQQILTLPGSEFQDVDEFGHPWRSVNIVGGYSSKLDSIIRQIIFFRTQHSASGEELPKFLVFSQWEQPLGVLARGLNENKIEFARFGIRNRADKKKALRKFESPETAVLLLNSRSQSSGLTLVSANHIILIEPLLNPALEKQATGRIYRIGQTRVTHVWKYFTVNSIEERINEVVQNRRLGMTKIEKYKGKMRANQISNDIDDLVIENLDPLAAKFEKNEIGWGEKVSELDLQDLMLNTCRTIGLVKNSKMKFGKKLEEEIFDSEWRYYYIQYKDMKKLLKKSMEKGEFTDEDEQFFEDSLHKQVATVCILLILALSLDLKGDELVKRIKKEKEIILGIEAELSESNQADVDDEMMLLSGDGSTSETESQHSHLWTRAEQARHQRDLRLDNVEKSLNQILKEVRDLSKFTTRNFTGCMKILKKHDKRTGRRLSRTFQEYFINNPIHIDEYYSSMVLRLSNLFEDIRTLRTGVKINNGPGIDSGNIVRKTTKYWVHPDNVLETKLRVLQHLPVLLFKKGENDPAITSIYFDSEEFDLYHNRIVRDESAQNLRFRWYGQWNKTEDVWVERKTHHESWVGVKSIKERFPIKEKDLNDFLAGRYNVKQISDKIIEKAKKNGKYSTEQEKEKVGKDAAVTEDLAREVQTMIIEKKLRPMIRTTYNRTAFQLPADARVRISLDTELAMIREDDFDKIRAGDNWRNVNVKNDFPFSYLEDSDIVRFPYAVLEIKLQTQHGQKVPQWAQDLANSHLVEAVPKFSKFHHGVSSLLSNHVTLLPFWYYQMDTDIKRPPPAIEPENQIGGSTFEEFEDDEDTPITSGSGHIGRLTREQRQNLPVKIDQFGKIYFSNERTMLRWLNFGIQGLAISMTLVNLSFSTPALVASTTFVFLSLACLAYAIIIFHVRGNSLRNFEDSSWFDISWGPVVVTVVLTIAIVAQVIWKARRDGFNL